MDCKLTNVWVVIKKNFGCPEEGMPADPDELIYTARSEAAAKGWLTRSVVDYKHHDMEIEQREGLLIGDRIVLIESKCWGLQADQVLGYGPDGFYSARKAAERSRERAAAARRERAETAKRKRERAKAKKANQ